MEKTMCCFLLIFVAVLSVCSYSENAPETVWQKVIGGSNEEEAIFIVSTPDGGYIFAGWTGSNDGDVKGSHGKLDAWVVKLDSKGDIIWQKILGGSNDDFAASVVPTPDGGYIVVGGTESNDGDVRGNHGKSDAWILKLNRKGNIAWQKVFGGSKDDMAVSVILAQDGGYIVVGWTESNDGDVKGSHGNDDFWVIKLDSKGNMIWQKTYGGSNNDVATSIIATPDGGYIVVGWTGSNDGDVKGHHNRFDFWIMKLDDKGDIVWQRVLGGSGYDIPGSVALTPDGGCIVVGDTESLDGDVTENRGKADLWVVRLDSEGRLLWQKTYGGSGWDSGWAVAAAPGGGYVIAGDTDSTDGDVKENHGKSDLWIFKIDEAGNIVWQRVIGGSGEDRPFSIALTPDGGYIIAGWTTSNDGDVHGNHGKEDAWIIKLGVRKISEETSSCHLHTITRGFVILTSLIFRRYICLVFQKRSHRRCGVFCC